MPKLSDVIDAAVVDADFAEGDKILGRSGTTGGLVSFTPGSMPSTDSTTTANVSTAGGLIVVQYDGSWPARPAVDGSVLFVNSTNTTEPADAVAGDLLVRVAA